MSTVSEIVLILEDNPFVSKQIQTALYKAGYVGHSVADRFELMEAIKRKAVGAVMLDLGLQTVRSYRKTMMKKIGVNNIAGLTQLALSAGLTRFTPEGAKERVI